MEWVVTRMAQPTTALSPEWDRWFDETFTNLISADEDLTRTEFDALIAASWPPPESPAPSNAVGPFSDHPDTSPGS